MVTSSKSASHSFASTRSSLGSNVQPSRKSTFSGVLVLDTSSAQSGNDRNTGSSAADAVPFLTASFFKVELPCMQ